MLGVQADALEGRAGGLVLHQFGGETRQRDVNKLREAMHMEAGRLRAKAATLVAADKARKLGRLAEFTTEEP